MKGDTTRASARTLLLGTVGVKAASRSLGTPFLWRVLMFGDTGDRGCNQLYCGDAIICLVALM